MSFSFLIYKFFLYTKIGKKYMRFTAIGVAKAIEMTMVYCPQPLVDGPILYQHFDDKTVFYNDII